MKLNVLDKTSVTEWLKQAMAEEAVYGVNMSIYATLGVFGVEVMGPYHEMCPVYCQGVPPHIDYTGPEWDWLPPPVANPELDSAGDYKQSYKYRAIFFVGPFTKKGTERNGQEFVDPLLVLSHDEFMTKPFGEIIGEVATKLEKQMEANKSSGTPISLQGATTNLISAMNDVLSVEQRTALAKQLSQVSAFL